MAPPSDNGGTWTPGSSSRSAAVQSEGRSALSASAAGSFAINAGFRPPVCLFTAFCVSVCVCVHRETFLVLCVWFHSRNSTQHPHHPSPAPPEMAQPRLDDRAAASWLYPEDPRFEFRAYQHLMAKAALFEDTLVSIPTGTGKTFIAAVVMHNFLRWFPDGLVVFLAMTRPLVQQQIRASCMSVGLNPDTDAQFMTGEDPPSTRRRRWAAASGSSARLIFCTPHILKNDLDEGLLDARRIVCCVFDEAHHAGGGQRTPYAHVARLLRQSGARCRVLALSATAGSTLGKVQTLIDMLAISRIEVKTEEELEHYMHGRKLHVVPVREPGFAQRRGSTAGGFKRGAGSPSGRRGKSSMRELLLAPAEAAFQRLHAVGSLGANSVRSIGDVTTADVHHCWSWIEQRVARDGPGLHTETWRRHHGLLSALVALADAVLGPPADNGGASGHGGGGEDGWGGCQRRRRRRR